MAYAFCHWRGQPVVLEITDETANLLAEAKLRAKESTQNILAEAFHRYGKSEAAIVKYLVQDFPREVK